MSIPPVEPCCKHHITNAEFKMSKEDDDDGAKKIKVFILLGQSNMVGMGKVNGADTEGTLEHAVKTKNLYQYLIDDNQEWKEVIDPRVRNLFTMGSGGFDKDKKTIKKNDLLSIQHSSTIGVEIGIGCVVGKWLESENYRRKTNGDDGGTEDILLLKSCIGNRSLGWDLLPPGSQSFEYTNEKDGKTYVYAGYKESPARWEKGTEPVPGNWYAGLQYDGDIARAKEILENLPKYIPGTKTSTTYEVAGFFWWQGDKDRYDKAYATNYLPNLVRLIQQLRNDFSAPNAKFVLATLGQTSKDANEKTSETERYIFNAQMDVPNMVSFNGNVACVYSKPFCHGGASNSHYNHNAETYMDVGLAMGRAMIGLLGNSESHKEEKK